jgi:hypothetical protein
MKALSDEIHEKWENTALSKRKKTFWCEKPSLRDGLSFETISLFLRVKVERVARSEQIV